MPDWSDLTDAILGFPFGLLLVIVAMLLIAATIKYGMRFLEWLYSWTFPKTGESAAKGSSGSRQGAEDVDAELGPKPHDDEDDGSPQSEDENVFEPRGRFWFIQFQSEDALVGNSIGAWRLSVLLSSPGTHISALRLIERAPATSGNTDPSGLEEQVERALTMKSETGEAPEMLGVSVSDLANPPIPLTNPKMIAEIRKQIKDYVDGKALSIDLAEQEALAVKIADFKKHLSKIADHEGNPRLTSHDAKKAGDAVRNSIQDTIIEIKENLPDLAKHLKQNLKYGQKPIYSPNPPIKWIVR